MPLLATDSPTWNRPLPLLAPDYDSDSDSVSVSLSSSASSPPRVWSALFPRRGRRYLYKYSHQSSFYPTMRVPKKPVSLCLSLFPRLLPRGTDSRVWFGSLCLSRPARFSGGRGGILTLGACQLHASYSMDGIHAPAVDDRTLDCSRMDSFENNGLKPCVWSSPEGGQKIDIAKQIFCNRSLNMRNIVAVGFDMDYTLAQYKPDTFESLAYEGTIKKLVYDLGYPIELLEWSFDWKYMVRGLVLDKKRGNILKMDRHKYVKVAYHGFRELTKEEKVSTYGSTLIRDSFDEPDYALIDTLFSLAEAYLFAQLVDFKEKNPGKIPDGIE